MTAVSAGLAPGSSATQSVWRGSLLLLCTLASCSAGADDEVWAYRVGEAVPAQQANFCDSTEAALEIAEIFQRFGPRTGFSALSNASQCSKRILAVTPHSLLRQVQVPLASGDGYEINFIQVHADDGSEAVLVTTRRLMED